MHLVISSRLTLCNEVPAGPVQLLYLSVHFFEYLDGLTDGWTMDGLKVKQTDE